MNVRPFSVAEQSNVRAIQAATTKVAYIYLTRTGLGKAIIDATAPLRDLLYREGLHDYKTQRQGEESKVELPALLLTDNGAVSLTATLYRPRTKQGDPRIWFSRLAGYVAAGQILAVVVYDRSLYLFNVSTSSLATAGTMNPAADFLFSVQKDNDAVALELLGRLNVIARHGPVQAHGSGSTAVGRTLEALLGIPMNSSREPDYKGIELKSHRQQPLGRATRLTLFAKVADWSSSKIKSSSELLLTFGYPDGLGKRKLYVTVVAQRPNRQTLQLRVDEAPDRLVEFSTGPLKDVLVWSLDELRKALRAKHSRTFWITAEPTWVDASEFFQYRSALYTKDPVISQLGPLLALGKIGIDHLIKTGKSDKGPLFRINAADVDLLFPPPILYQLG